GKTGTELITERHRKYKVSEYQSVPIVVKEDVYVYDDISSMFLEDVGTLFVVDEHACLTGVLSRIDLLRASIGQKDLNVIPVHIIMTRMPNIAICYKEDLLIDAAKKLIDRQIDGLPVVKDSKHGCEVIGRITKTTITKVFVELITDNNI